MRTPIPIWKTLSESILIAKQHKYKWLSALIIPILLTLALNLATTLNAIFPPKSSINGILLCLTPLVWLAVSAWIMNVSVRIALTGSSDGLGWSMRETYSLFWMFVLASPSMIFCIMFYSLFTHYQISSNIPLVGLALMLLMNYAAARILPFFTSIAIGEKTSLGNALMLTKGNGCRLILLFNIAPVVTTLLIAPVLFYYKLTLTGIGMTFMLLSEIPTLGVNLVPMINIVSQYMFAIDGVLWHFGEQGFFWALGTLSIIAILVWSFSVIVIAQASRVLKN